MTNADGDSVASSPAVGRSRGCDDHAIVAVSDGELRDAVRALTYKHGLVVEGAGTAAAAAVLSRRIVDARPGAPIVAVPSGPSSSIHLGAHRRETLARASA